jgi:hypothetical protein
MGRDFLVATGDEFPTVPDRTPEVFPRSSIYEADHFFAAFLETCSVAWLCGLIRVHPMRVYNKLIQFGWLRTASLNRTSVKRVRFMRLFDVLCQCFGFLELGSRCALPTADCGAAVHGRFVLCLEVLVEALTRRKINRLRNSALFFD